MENTLNVLLLKAKNNSDALEEVLKIFRPIIKAYSRKSGWGINAEDMESILTIRLIELVKSMAVYAFDGQNVKYISTAIKYHFLNTIKRDNKIQTNETFDLTGFENRGQEDEIDTQFIDMIKELDRKKQKILILKFKDMLSDQEIAQELNVTRQAVNKQLRKAYQQLIPFAK